MLPHSYTLSVSLCYKSLYWLVSLEYNNDVVFGRGVLILYGSVVTLNVLADTMSPLFLYSDIYIFIQDIFNLNNLDAHIAYVRNLQYVKNLEGTSDADIFGKSSFQRSHIALIVYNILLRLHGVLDFV